MYEPNVNRILDSLSPTDVVLDIGGWARPFNRANFVMDAEPYETRGYYGALVPAQGGDKEFFDKSTWIVRDICERTPYPFKDKELDFVICSHTLEDIRDPLWVCSEMIRIAKRGYIEIPSRVAETCRGIEPGQVGWSHHRWLIDTGDNHVQFTMKYHRIHSHWRFSFPESYLRSLTEEQLVQWLFWDSEFGFAETTIHGVDNIAASLENFVQQTAPYSPVGLKLDSGIRKAEGFRRRVVGKARRILGEGRK